MKRLFLFLTLSALAQAAPTAAAKPSGSLLKQGFKLFWRPDERIVARATKHYCDNTISGYNLSDSAYNAKIKYCIDENKSQVKKGFELYKEGKRYKKEYVKCDDYLEKKLSELRREHALSNSYVENETSMQKEQRRNRQIIAISQAKLAFRDGGRALQCLNELKVEYRYEDSIRYALNNK